MLSPLLLNIVLEVLVRKISQEKGKKKKKHPVQGREKIKLSLLTDDKILYIENPNKCTKTVRTNKQVLFAGYKINVQKSFVFYILAMSSQKMKSRK